MIRSLRKKFILVGMLSVLLAELLMIGAIDVINYRSTIKDIKSQMSILVENGGNIPNNNPIDRSPRDRDSRINEETPFMLRFFTVTIDANGEVTDCDIDRIAMVDEQRASSIGKQVYAQGRSAGFYEDYYYEKTDNQNTADATDTKLIFLDCRRDISAFTSFRNISIIVGLIGAVLVFIILTLASRRVLAPVEESYKKQKRFITDASHEIKTPLAIISADAEVLELYNEDSEWVESIKNQVRRLTELTEKLVFLSRMDEGDSQMAMSDVDLSELVKETAEAYAPMAASSGKRYDIHIEDGLHTHGNKENLTQMVNLLIDNAYKYSNENGEIRFSLNTKGKKKRLAIYNTVDNIEKGDLSMLFERFYRSDESRSSETGGHGIGLSVVAAIAEAHGGRATAESTDGRSVTFSVILP